MTVTGNADVTGDTAFSFIPVVESFYEPSEYASSMMAVYKDFYDDVNLFSPLFIDDQDDGSKKFMFGLGFGMDFNDDGKYEPNSTGNGVRMTGEIRGQYFIYNGPITLTRTPNGNPEETISYTFDQVYASGKVATAANGKPTVSGARLMVHSHDCAAPAEFYDDHQMGAAIGLVCDQETDDIFAYLGFSALSNDMDKQTFALAAAGPQGLQFTFEPGLQAKYQYLYESQVMIEIYENDVLVKSSTDFPGSISIPAGWENAGTHWERFNSLRFSLPEESEMGPGSYHLRMVIGLDAFETNFTVS